MTLVHTVLVMTMMVSTTLFLATSSPQTLFSSSSTTGGAFVHAQSAVPNTAGVSQVADPASLVHYYPRTVPLADIRTKDVVITFVFPVAPNCGSMCLQTTQAAGRFWNRWVSFRNAVQEIEKTQPYGWNSHAGNVCPPATCVVQGNASNIVELHWQPTSDFDVYEIETVTVTFSGRLLPNLVASGVDFLITVTPEDLTPNPMAYVLSISAVTIHLVTIAMFPFSLDTGGFLLSVAGACTRSDARNFLPLATFGVLPFGGDTFGARLWRVGAFLLVAALALAAWMAISGTRAMDLQSARLQATVPLICAQLALYFLPGISFASGALIAKFDPLLQVVGVCLVVIFTLVMLAVHSWVFRRSTWKYVNAPLPPEPEAGQGTWRDTFERLTLHEGFWLDTKEGEEQLNATILPREARGGTPAMSSLQAGFWLLNILTYTVSGLSASTAFLCILQRAGSAGLWLLTAVFVSKVKPFRAGFLNICGTWIRVFTAFGIVIQGVSPGLEKNILFFVMICFALPLEVLRIVINFRGFMARTKDAVRAQLEIDKTEVERMLKQRESELERARREEEAAARALEARMESKRRREMRRRGPMLGEIAVGGDPVEFAAAEGPEESENPSEHSTSIMAAEAVNAQGQEPKYLRDAMRAKPLNAKGALTMGATWFPTERPHARTTGEADLPLHIRPYEVRKHDEPESLDTQLL